MSIIFSHQTKGTMAQVLSIISAPGAETFLYKHLGYEQQCDGSSFLPIVSSAPPEALKNMLIHG
jgi:hypothetical protein